MSETGKPKQNNPDKKASNQPKLTELSPEQLDKVSGGQKIKFSDITITKPVDKSSP